MPAGKNAHGQADRGGAKRRCLQDVRGRRNPGSQAHADRRKEKQNLARGRCDLREVAHIARPRQEKALRLTGKALGQRSLCLMTKLKMNNHRLLGGGSTDLSIGIDYRHEVARPLGPSMTSTVSAVSNNARF